MIHRTVHSIVDNWLGLPRHEVDLVVEIVGELADQQKIDLDEASVDQIRKLADEAFQVCEDEHWFKDF
jgi:hypothetical protein